MADSKRLDELITSLIDKGLISLRGIRTLRFLGLNFSISPLFIKISFKKFDLRNTFSEL